MTKIKEGLLKDYNYRINTKQHEKINISHETTRKFFVCFRVFDFSRILV
jgi:hypothetical protein